MPAIRVVLIAAASRNGVLAAEGKIPWHLPRDVAHFRARTAGRWLLLGRTTYEQMAGWFQPGQVPVVLTRRSGYVVPGGWVVPSVAAALALAGSHGAAELVVCGGGQVYQAALPFADEVILTTVDTDVPGGIRFPPLPPDQWTVRQQESFPADAANRWPITITRHVRR